MLGFIFKLNKIHNEAHEIKHDENKRNHVFKYGLYSIIFTILQIALSYASYFALKFDGNTGVEILIIICGFITILLSIYCLLGSLFFLIIQFYMNRKFISILALIFFIVLLFNSSFILFYYK